MPRQVNPQKSSKLSTAVIFQMSYLVNTVSYTLYIPPNCLVFVCFCNYDIFQGHDIGKQMQEVISSF